MVFESFYGFWHYVEFNRHFNIAHFGLTARKIELCDLEIDNW